MKVGLVGYGKMGRGIFSLLSDAPLEVAVLVRDPAKADRNNRRLERRLRRAANSEILDEADLADRLAGLRFTSSWKDLRDCGLVIETVTEDYETKIEVLGRAERTVSPEAVITSNSSSLSTTRMAERLRDPARFCGFHFFHPIQLTSVVEIITSRDTAAGTVDFLRRVSREIGRTPLVVKDLAGSCINVALTCHSCEALYVLEQGLALPSRIDAIAVSSEHYWNDHATRHGHRIIRQSFSGFYSFQLVYAPGGPSMLEVDLILGCAYSIQVFPGHGAAVPGRDDTGLRRVSFAEQDDE